MQARVTVTLKTGVLDPQGQAITGSLRSLGFAGVTGVRQGKVFDLDLVDSDAVSARAVLTAMCDRLLANTVIETYAIEIAEPSARIQEPPAARPVEVTPAAAATPPRPPEPGAAAGPAPAVPTATTPAPRPMAAPAVETTMPAAPQPAGIGPSRPQPEASPELEGEAEKPQSDGIAGRIAPDPLGS
jgi:phosphoribosylformylglycinamidine synthase